MAKITSEQAQRTWGGRTYNAYNYTTVDSNPEGDIEKASS